MESASMPDVRAATQPDGTRIAAGPECRKRADSTRTGSGLYARYPAHSQRPAKAALRPLETIAIGMTIDRPRPVCDVPLTANRVGSRRAFVLAPATIGPGSTWITLLATSSAT
jgi:hypothetical protein